MQKDEVIHTLSCFFNLHLSSKTTFVNSKACPVSFFPICSCESRGNLTYQTWGTFQTTCIYKSSQFKMSHQAQSWPLWSNFCFPNVRTPLVITILIIFSAGAWWVVNTYLKYEIRIRLNCSYTISWNISIWKTILGTYFELNCSKVFNPSMPSMFVIINNVSI